MVKPYSITHHEGGRLHTFTTDQGIQYSCVFGEVPLIPPFLGVYDLEVRDFSFYPYDPTPHIKKKIDERVAPTLMEILNHFFSRPERILVYICDDSEGLIKARARQKLFNSWYQTVTDVMERHELEVEIEDLNLTLYGGVVLSRNCPHPEIARQYLVERASEIIFEKYGY
ncbi:DUF6169 family protein [Paraflavisolibacter sp. H34]|uniref:DUF6169 family protein n=1 Tax=Huijunlia imazamoxiresistens TaxID=3127457 RepID=UPI00301AFD93